MLASLVLPLLLAFSGPAWAAPSPKAAPPTEADRWEATVERVTEAVVAIRVSATRGFDTETASTSVATGFVVDAERGILLTNRHVVQPGPVVAMAVFSDHQEVPLVPVYRDPVHDFGFYRFDPQALRGRAPVALPLYPEGARVGAEIRVMGNDAGEKLSILSGILARLDRDAPVYGRGYNDVNTFYYQAASGTSGGSSGSPVVDVEGRVIALNAGGRKDAASSFYLPLDRVKRALALLQAGAPIPRGTWQAVLDYQPYDELRRLGLPTAVEDEVRAAFPAGTGMLVVTETVPGGPARDRLQPGDVLVRVDGVLTTTFVPLEARLDDRVGASVAVQVARGGKLVSVDVPVDDLHALAPSAFLEVGGSVLHPLSLQLARNYGVAARGIFAVPGGTWLGRAGIDDPAVITAVNGAPVETLDALEAALSGVPEGAPVQVRYFLLGDPFQSRLATPRMSWRWFPVQRCTRDDTTGYWPCRALPVPAGRWSPPPATVTPFAPRDRTMSAIAPSLVWVQYQAPLRPEGVYGDNFIGTGVVIDAARGLVLTDRDTVPVAAGEVRLTFGGALEVPADVVMIHPFHNLAVVAYDPAALADTPVQSAELRDHPLEVGDEVWSIGFADPTELVSAKTTIRDLALLDTPLPDPPLFRDTNLAVAEVSDLGRAVGGVFTDKKGRVVALNASFVEAGRKPWGAIHRGIPTEVVLDAVGPLLRGEALRWRALGVELGRVSIAQAQVMGLPPEEAKALLGHEGFGRVALSVRRPWAGTPAASLLRGGDLLLRVDGESVTHPREVEEAATRPEVRLTVLRDAQVVELTVPTVELGGEGVRRFVLWGGALLHETPLAVSMQRGVPPGGVYVAWIWHGSPAQAFALWPTRRIVAVDDVPTPDLDALLAAVAGRPDRSPVRVRLKALDGKESVVTLMLDQHYWPTDELSWAEGGWTRARR